MTKIGTGTQTLSGTNTYSGLTTVSAGTLQLGTGGNTGSISSAQATVAAGALARGEPLRRVHAEPERHRRRNARATRHRRHDDGDEQ